MRLLLLILLFALTFVSSTPIREAKPSGLTIPSLDVKAAGPDIVTFVTSAPNYIAKAFGSSGTACSISRVLPIFCREPSLDHRRPDEMADEQQTVQACGSGFDGWVCSVMAHTSLIAFLLLIVAPLLALGAYKWRKVNSPSRRSRLRGADVVAVKGTAREAVAAAQRAAIVSWLQPG